MELEHVFVKVGERIVWDGVPGEFSMSQANGALQIKVGPDRRAAANTDLAARRLQIQNALGQRPQRGAGTGGSGGE